MDHTLKWGTPSSKFSYFKLFKLLVLAGLFNFCFCSGISQVTKTVKDVAVLSCGYNISTDELTRVRVYWQKYHEMVLAVINGKVQVWPKYENRTFTDISKNLSIVILALRLSDSGMYTCVIQKTEKGSYKREHLISVMLFVRADFLVPNITDLGNPSTNIKRIICSTSGGFPKPQLSWWENGRELDAINTTVSQDPETELYTINGKLDFDVTNNHSFICLVTYGNLTVSQTFNWRKSEPPSPSSYLIWLWFLLPLSVGAIIIPTLLHNRFTTRRNN